MLYALIFAAWTCTKMAETSSPDFFVETLVGMCQAQPAPEVQERVGFQGHLCLIGSRADTSLPLNAGTASRSLCSGGRSLSSQEGPDFADMGHGC